MKLTVDRVLPHVLELYRHHSAGCCLHIVLDDGNVQDHSVQFCAEKAKQVGHLQCFALANRLLKMTKTQRTKLYKARKS